jgi:multidrug efflux pump subunit AcrA (membrane-fusion protein)
MKTKTKRIITIGGVLIAIAGLIIFNRVASVKKPASAYTRVKEGSFKVAVTTSGELIASKSVDIKGPVLQTSTTRGRGRHSRIHFRNIKITDIVPEGTMVNKGDYIAQLDRTNFDNTLKDEQDNLKDMENDLHMKVLDTAVVLTDLRDQIKNQVFAVEEASITLDQDKYEPPATIRKDEVELDKEQRKLTQMKKMYKLQAAQQLKEINNIKINIDIQKRTVEDLQNYLAGFTIVAPSPGMVVYKRNRDGTKRKAGSSLNPWDMVVATLPDLSSLISKTYISEVDVSKVKPGQEVNIKIDAFPQKAYTGKVLSISKVGEELPNSDTKMFEVQCSLDGVNSDLRPSMTTSNEIIITSFEDVIYVPLECVHTGQDGIPFVYTRHKTRQIVVLGKANDKNVIVKQGLQPGTSIYLYTPSDPDSFTLEGKNLITGIEKTDTDNRALSE